MTTERKKQIANTLKELNLYPHYSKAGNLVRGAVLIASWVVGIAVNHPTSAPKFLGGAYFMFSITLLCEFVPRSKKSVFAQLINAVFCILALSIFVLSLFLVFRQDPQPTDAVLLNTMNALGWAIVVIIIIEVLVALTEIHKLVYGEKAETEVETEANREHERKRFMENLTGEQRGDDK